MVETMIKSRVGTRSRMCTHNANHNSPDIVCGSHFEHATKPHQTGASVCNPGLVQKTHIRASGSKYENS